ncbi:hypothetical protein K1719_006614 [Acacia pycnantha]|nr:hypothetical protein K1719_006614 [Acacia pycnantha]
MHSLEQFFMQSVTTSHRGKCCHLLLVWQLQNVKLWELEVVFLIAETHASPPFDYGNQNCAQQGFNI